MIGSIVDVRDVRFRWHGQDKDLLHIPELVINRGEHLFVQGPSGSGKTTLLNLLTGVNLPTDGAITVLGTPLADLSSSRRDQFRADYLGVIFQQFNLLPYLSLLQNVQLPCGFSRRKWTNAGDVDASSRRLLAHLGLAESLLNQPVSQLSVGQQQRAAVARALMGGPEIVIADEPTSALDLHHQEVALSLAKELCAEGSYGVLVVLHDLNLAAAWADEVVLLKDGKVVENGCPTDVLTEKVIDEVYGVDAIVMAHPLTGRPVVTIDRSQFVRASAMVRYD